MSKANNNSAMIRKAPKPVGKGFKDDANYGKKKAMASKLKRNSYGNKNI